MENFECDGEVCHPKKGGEQTTTHTGVTSPATSTNPLDELVGGELLSKADEAKIKTTSISTKYVLLYFSAHWCAPCQQFTPKLVEFYNRFKTEKNFEIVFISSDQSPEEFSNYYKTMPWLAVPYEYRYLKNKISRKFKVHGIPTLIVLESSSASVITTEGRAKIVEDSQAVDFPWVPKSIFYTIGEDFLSKTPTAEKPTIANKVLALYFSASWCGPCRAFLQNLKKVYEKVKGDGKAFEIIWISFDHDQESFDNYYKSMPWLAIPYQDEKRRMELANLFKVEGIPHLVIIDQSGEIISKNARNTIANDLEGNNYPWYPKQVVGIEDADFLNEETTLLVICPVDQELKRTAFKVLEESVKTLGNHVLDDIKFVVGDVNHPLVKQICDFIQFKNMDVAHVIILDIPDSGAWYAIENLNANDVVEGVKKFKSQNLHRNQLMH